MAFTYLILNIVFLACIVFLFVQNYRKPSKTWWITLGAVLLLTAIFDSLIVWAGIVGYDTSKILGIYIGYAPIEDFFYAVLAVILVPVFWQQFKPKKGKKQ